METLFFFGDLLFIPYLDVDLPIVYLSDITYDQLRGTYIKFNEEKDKSSIFQEKMVLEKSHRIIFSSEWIKRKAIEFYSVDPDKISIVEFGANIPSPLNYSIEINTDVCNLVFIGRDWKRKGGAKVLQIYGILKNDGFPCTLTIIGSTPEEEPDDDEDLTIIPFLDKTRKDHLEVLCNILSNSHFLLLSTIFDAFGIVFCEASAYALPSITSNVGGVGQVVREGANGYLLPSDATANDYATKIKKVFRDKGNYLKLRKSSRQEYEDRLNWDVWDEKINIIMEAAVSEWKLRNKKREK